MTDLLASSIKSTIRTKKAKKSTKNRVYVVLTPKIADYMQQVFNVNRRVDLAQVFILLAVLRKHNIISQKAKLTEEQKNEIAELVADLTSKDED